MLREGAKPGPSWSLLSISIENGAGASEDELLEVDAVDINSLPILVLKERMKAFKGTWQTEMTVDRGDLESALFLFDASRESSGSLCAEDSSELVLE